MRNGRKAALLQIEAKVEEKMGRSEMQKNVCADIFEMRGTAAHVCTDCSASGGRGLSTARGRGRGVQGPGPRGAGRSRATEGGRGRGQPVCSEVTGHGDGSCWELPCSRSKILSETGWETRLGIQGEKKVS